MKTWIQNTFVTIAGMLAFPAIVQAADVTFTKDVAPIMFNHCTACHRDTEVAPFALTSYQEAKKHAKQIGKVTHSRQMPPWKAEPGFGEFEDDRRLTEAQIDVIQKWVESGTPEGDPKDLPAMPKFPEGWQLGKPDVVLKMPEAYTLRAERPDVFRCFVLPLEIPAGKYIKAVEYRPGNTKITHHALFFLDTTGQARKLDAADPDLGYAASGGVGFLPSGGLGGWAPGATPRPFPPGVSREIKPGTDLIIQTHFHPSGKIETEQSTIGLYLTDEAPKRQMVNIPLGVRSTIDIAPGVKDYKWADSITLPVAVEVPGITPHAHYLCKDMQVWATLPTGEKKWLIWIKDWDFDWQGQYRYKTPIQLPAGTKIDMVYTYDNTADNPRNPNNPPQRVRRGEQTTDEMGITFIPVIPKSREDAQAIRAAMREHFLKGVGGGGAALLQRLRGGGTDQPAN